MDQLDARFVRSTGSAVTSASPPESWGTTRGSASSSEMPPLVLWPPYPKGHRDHTARSQGLFVEGHALTYRPAWLETFLVLSGAPNQEQAEKRWRVAELSDLTASLTIASCSLCRLRLPEGSKIFLVEHISSGKKQMFGPCCAKQLKFIQKWLLEQRVV